MKIFRFLPKKNKKKDPARGSLSVGSFFSESEYVVEGYSPGIVYVVGFVKVAVAVSCERIFSVQVHVLHEGNFTDSIPEFYFFQRKETAAGIEGGQRIKDIGLETGAACVHAAAYVIISDVQLPAADFLQIAFAVANACIPRGVFHIGISSGVLPVFAEYTEILYQNDNAYAPYFHITIFFSLFLKRNVICIDINYAKISISFCIEDILIFQACLFDISARTTEGVVAGIELAITYSEVDFAELCSGIHPSLVTRPVRWSCRFPLGLIHRADPPRPVQDFLDAVRRENEIRPFRLR